MNHTTTDGRTLELRRLSVGGLMDVVAEIPNLNLEPDETGELMLVSMHHAVVGVTDPEERRRRVAEFASGKSDVAAVLAIMRQAAAPIRVLVSHVAGIPHEEVNKLDVEDVLAILTAWLQHLDGLAIIEQSIAACGRLGEIFESIRATVGK